MLDHTCRATLTKLSLCGEEGAPMYQATFTPREVSEEMFEHQALQLTYENASTNGVGGTFNRRDVKAKVVLGAYVAEKTKQRTIKEAVVSSVSLIVSTDKENPMKAKAVLVVSFEDGQWLSEHYKREFNVELEVTQLELPET